MGYRRIWMLAGFIAAFGGDWMLAIKASPVRSPGFFAGVCFFACAHILWTIGQLKESRPDWRAFVCFAASLLAFTGVRLAPHLPMPTSAAIVVYSAISAFSLSVAVAGRRMFYSVGILLLVFSDLMIGARMLHVPGCGVFVEPAYILAEVLLIVSFFMSNERRFSCARGNALRVVAPLCGLAAISFVLAAHLFPGGGYNPTMRMLSALGRVRVRLVDYPWSHHCFVLGMTFAVAGVLFGARRLRLSPWGTALNAAGLLVIALVPEDVFIAVHNAGCWLAAIGGSVMLFFWFRAEPSRKIRWAWAIALLLPLVALGAALLSHELKLSPFAPWVTSAQKLLILSFPLWLWFLAARGARRRAIAFASIWLLAPVALAAFLFTRPAGLSAADILADAPEAAAEEDVRALPLSDDELAALAWLEKVTGRMGAEEERDWWDIGGSQHGIFAKRYNIAFAGYAAAAVGMRGDASVRARVGKVLGNCIERMLARDVWAYSQSRSYWGRKPWAPDPCYRENVMYTGHLLQLLAMYEHFTGDRRYHRKGGGWDFVWKGGRKVHYDVEKLVSVTVTQMRKGPNGGITCEPGLMFFPCNNHPHVALGIFRRLGYGNWSADAARWEKWALAHYFSPRFGGGAINLVYHVKSKTMYPRGQDGLDGWSFLWYEAWASDRRIAQALWRRARESLDWNRLESCGDATGEMDCCDPQPVSASVAAVFLAAAARACGDAETAERLEGLVDAKYLKRERGLYRLDLDRNWRIGATAMRIIALAESRGSRFRDLVVSAAAK